MKNKAAYIAGAVCFVAFMGGAARGDDWSDWVGNLDNNWVDAGNWQQNDGWSKVPEASSFVVFGVVALMARAFFKIRFLVMRLSLMNRGTLLGFFACFILFANAGGLTADVVTFGDPTLEASIRLQLKIPQGQPVTSNEMLGLQDVQASNVSSLQGLQYATNLQRFSLFTSVPVDLSPVGDLPQLNTLDVLNSSSASLNLQPLSGLTSLQSGTFQGPMGNYPAPQNWQSLLSLNVSGGAVHDSDISMISRLNNLQSLTISACPVRNIQPLSQLNKLTAFCIGQTPWTDLSQLSGLTNLQHLFVVDTGITDISSMPALPNLRELDLSWNGIQNISALQRLSQLWVLRMDSTGITDLRPLSTLSQLDALSLRGNGIADISPLSDLIHLDQVDLSCNSISDLEPLRGMQNLAALCLRDNDISNIEPISQDPIPSSLDLSYNPLDANALNKYIPLLEQNNPWLTVDHYQTPEPSSCLIFGVTCLIASLMPKGRLHSAF